MHKMLTAKFPGCASNAWNYRLWPLVSFDKWYKPKFCMVFLLWENMWPCPHRLCKSLADRKRESNLNVSCILLWYQICFYILVSHDLYNIWKWQQHIPRFSIEINPFSWRKKTTPIIDCASLLQIENKKVWYWKLYFAMIQNLLSKFCS